MRQPACRMQMIFQRIVADAGVIDQDIHAPVSFDRARHSLFARGGIGGIKWAQLTAAPIAFDERQGFRGIGVTLAETDENVAPGRGVARHKAAALQDADQPRVIFTLPSGGIGGGRCSAPRRRMLEKINRLKKCITPSTTRTRPTFVLSISRTVCASVALSPYFRARVTYPMLIR